MASTQKSQGKWDRDVYYRSVFLKNNPGLFGKFYFCVYCGKPLTRKSMQVDHHIAVNRVKLNPLYKAYFNIANAVTNLFGKLVHGKKYKKNVGVNVSYNLVPACARCNNKKSDNGGLWIIRGMIGGTVWKILNLLSKLLRRIFKSPVTYVLLAAAAAYLIFFTPALSTITASFTAISSSVGEFVQKLLSIGGNF